MKVFITWSGDRSRQLAEAVRDWLPGVIQAVSPYFSPDDVAKGSRWSTEVAKNLEECSVGLLCLTAGNLSAPWVLFEAGALSKNLGKSKVTPILFGIEPTDIKGPLVQFQAARFNKSEVNRVVKMINAELGDDALTASVLDSVFQMWWPKLEEKVDEILRDAGGDEAESPRSERDMLEEILALTRTQTRRLDPRLSPKVLIHLARSLSQLVEKAIEAGVVRTLSEPIGELIEGQLYLLRRSDDELSRRIGSDLDSLRDRFRVAQEEEEQRALADDDIPF